MKTFLQSLVAVVVTCLATAHVSLRGADVFAAHEWGTFTAVVGSDGMAVPWWTPSLEGAAALPEFVSSIPNFSKTSDVFTLRMETPVIYFYPPKAMEVKVTANFANGRITEAFPAGVSGVNMMPGNMREWRVNLLPPGAQHESATPKVGQRGAHYSHAREVPDAWVVRSVQPRPSISSPNEKPDTTPQFEKFIFYRGAGSTSLPVNVLASGENEIQIGSPFPFQTTAFFIRVRDGRLSWDSALIRSEDGTAGGWKHFTHPVPDEERTMKRSISLSAALVQALHTAGLTPDESRAMVATWADTWFKDEGLRVLYLLPSEWVDATLPLHIEPKPAELHRVFVARAEILTRAQEQKLAVMLDADVPDDARVKNLESMRLGRFLSAAVERAVRIKEFELRDRYHRASMVLTNRTTVADQNRNQ